MRWSESFLRQRRDAIIVNTPIGSPDWRVDQECMVEVDAIDAKLAGDDFQWLTPSVFDPEAQRLSRAYPAPDTFRLEWRVSDEERDRITQSMRAKDRRFGYEGMDLFYAYSGSDEMADAAREGWLTGDYSKVEERIMAHVADVGPDWGDAAQFYRKGGDEPDDNRRREEGPYTPTGRFRSVPNSIRTSFNDPRLGLKVEQDRTPGKFGFGMTVSLKTAADMLRPSGDTQARYYSQLFGIPVQFDTFSESRDDYVFRMDGQTFTAAELNMILDCADDGVIDPPVTDTLSAEIREDQERIAGLAAQTPPGFMRYEDAKAAGLVDEDPWPTTDEIVAAHAAKAEREMSRLEAETELARLEARNALKKALRDVAMKASITMIVGVIGCIVIGLCGALIVTAFNYFMPRMETSDTAANAGGLVIIALLAAILGSLVASAGSRR